MNIKIKFLQDRVVKDGTGTKFKAGQVIELPYASAHHWLTRNVAVAVVDEEPVEAEKETTPEDTPAPKKRGRFTKAE